MLKENIKILRKAKRLSQEELAARLNVVRQTVSKWEKGLSVPDSVLLIRIAEIFEVTVSELLGSKIAATTAADSDLDIIAERLSRINEQLAIKNQRSRRIWKAIATIIAIIIGINILLVAISMMAFNSFKHGEATIVEIQSEIVEEME